MKYWTVGENEGAQMLGSATSAKRFLRDNPQVQTLTRWWWSGSDLIECDEYSRDEILGNKAAKLNKGMTAQWALDHHAT